MATQHHFLISFIEDNQPKSHEIFLDDDTLSTEDAEQLIRQYPQHRNTVITDIQVVGIHHSNNPDVHPGHYQQPEGNI